MIQDTDQIQDTLSFTEARTFPLRPVQDTTAGMQSIDFPQPPPRSSFFRMHHLQPGKIQPHPVKDYYSSWILGIFLISFILLAWVNVFFHKRFRQVLAATFSKRYMSQVVREGDLLSERLTMVLSIVYLLTFTLLVFQVYALFLRDDVTVPLTDFQFYLIILGLLTLYWFLKILLIRFLGNIFKTYQTTDAYLLNIFITSFLGTVILLPTLVFVVYLKSEILLYLALSLYGVIFLIRFVKGFFIGISLTRFSFFYLFVYLCSLEILPWVILIKVLLRNYF